MIPLSLPPPTSLHYSLHFLHSTPQSDASWVTVPLSLLNSVNNCPFSFYLISQPHLLPVFSTFILIKGEQDDPQTCSLGKYQKLLRFIFTLKVRNKLHFILNKSWGMWSLSWPKTYDHSHRVHLKYLKGTWGTLQLRRTAVNLTCRLDKCIAAYLCTISGLLWAQLSCIAGRHFILWATREANILSILNPIAHLGDQMGWKFFLQYQLLTMPKPLTMWITINCGKFWKRWEYQTTWPASWETCMHVRKQQLELDMEQQTGSK